jgi:hypothetical protein
MVGESVLVDRLSHSAELRTCTMSGSTLIAASVDGGDVLVDTN